MLGALGLLMVVLVAITISNGVHYNYHDYYDDNSFIEAWQNHGVLGGTLYLFNNCNGRFVSHLLASALLPIITSSQLLQTGFYVLNVILFTIAISWFLKRFFLYRYAVELSSWQALVAGSLFYSLFFFFFFAKRFEFWYWLADVFIYEYSLILILILNAILLRKKGVQKLGLVVAGASLCIGFMSETQAIAQLIVLGFMIFEDKKLRQGITVQARWKIVSASLIIVALTTNYLSPGNLHKIKISKTHVEGTGNYIQGLTIFVKDVVLRWDCITIDSFGAYRLNSLFIQIACAALLFLFLRLLTPYWFGDRKPMVQDKSIFGLLSIAVIILVITYLLPAVLYANVLGFVVDRCKLIGCFFMFLALFDVMVMLTGIAKGQNKQV